MTNFAKVLFESLNNINTNTRRTFNITADNFDFEIYANISSIKIRVDFRKEGQELGSELYINHDSAYESFNDGEGKLDIDMFRKVPYDQTDNEVDFIDKVLKCYEADAVLLNFWKGILTSKECKVTLEQFFKRMEAEG